VQKETLATACSDKWDHEKRYLRRLQRRYNAIVRELPEPEKEEDALAKTHFFKEIDRDVKWKKGSIPAALKYRRMLNRIQISEKHGRGRRIITTIKSTINTSVIAPLHPAINAIHHITSIRHQYRS
jgi:hypothetical protein